MDDNSRKDIRALLKTFGAGSRYVPRRLRQDLVQ